MTPEALFWLASLRARRPSPRHRVRLEDLFGDSLASLAARLALPVHRQKFEDDFGDGEAFLRVHRPHAKA